MLCAGSDCEASRVTSGYRNKTWLDLTRRNAGVTNEINNGCGAFECPSKPGLFKRAQAAFRIPGTVKPRQLIGTQPSLVLLLTPVLLLT